MSKGSQIQTQEQLLLQTLSPQQLLLIKLLELPNVELIDRIHTEILDNPALEEGKDNTAEEESGTEDFNENTIQDMNSSEDISLGDYLSEDDIPDYLLQAVNKGKDDYAVEIPISEVVSFYEVLKEQLEERNLSEKERTMADYIIGSLDDDGWLRKSMFTLVEELAIYHDINTDAEELEKVLHIIQDFDPSGIGARNLQECLVIQLSKKPESMAKTIGMNILTKCFDDFTHKNKEKILLRLDITDDAYEEAVAELVKLNPRPGSSLGEVIGKNMQQIDPDFFVETMDDGNIILSLNNSDIPHLRLSLEYSLMLKEYTGEASNKATSSDILYLKQKVEAAQGFINALKQRQQTLLSTMQAIIDIQRPFFLEGDETLLKPMILKDVAERAKLDISTVSRVSNCKYVQTNFGIFPLKHFFEDAFTAQSGEEFSVRQIKKILQEAVEKEDKKNPYKDDELAEILKEKGFPIARRTIAKYRDELNIPTARLRR